MCFLLLTSGEDLSINACWSSTRRTWLFYYYCLGIPAKIISFAVKARSATISLAGGIFFWHTSEYRSDMFTTLQTAVKTRNNRFSREYHIFNKCINRICRNRRLWRNFARTLLEHQGTELRQGFLYYSPFHGYGGHFEFYCFKYLLWDAEGANSEYLSCDRREHNGVGKLFDTTTLRVYKKDNQEEFVTGFIRPNDSRSFSVFQFLSS